MNRENHLEIKSIQKVEKNSKNQNEIAALEQKTTSERANFCIARNFCIVFQGIE